MSVLTSQEFRALGTGCRIVVDAEHLDAALDVALEQIGIIDAACSRFRDDSELMRVNARAGHWVTATPTFLMALDVALTAARRSDGAVDPTIGNIMRAIGYDDDFAKVVERKSFVRPFIVKAAAVPGWRTVEVDHENSRVRLAVGTSLDLGATAKALAADLAAAAITAATGSGVLVSLGGDIAVAGPAPEGGWIIDIGDSHAGDDVQQTIAITSGGLATSSTSVRRWVAGSQTMHHIVDPVLGTPVANTWRTVSAFGLTCVDANIATTTAIVKGKDAPLWLIQNCMAARLKDENGLVTTVNDWPKA